MVNHAPPSGTILFHKGTGWFVIKPARSRHCLMCQKDASGLESTVDLNQLGQILAVRTPFGFELVDGVFAP